MVRKRFTCRLNDCLFGSPLQEVPLGSVLAEAICSASRLFIGRSPSGSVVSPDPLSSGSIVHQFCCPWFDFSGSIVCRFTFRWFNWSLVRVPLASLTKRFIGHLFTGSEITGSCVWSLCVRELEIGLRSLLSVMPTTMVMM